MKLKAKILHFTTKGPLVTIIHQIDARSLSLNPLDRIKIKKDQKTKVAVVDLAYGKKEIKPGEIGIFLDVADELKIKNNDELEISIELKPESIYYIKKKLDKQELNKKEIDAIIKDLLANKLTEAEATYFVAACYVNGMTLDESAYLAEAIVNNSGRLHFDKKTVVDKHCLTPEMSILIKEDEKVRRVSIGKFVDKFLEESISNPIKRELNENIEIASFDKDFKISFKKIKRIFKIPSPEIIYELILRENKKIRLTGDHKIFLLKNGKIVKKPVSECEKEEHVIVPRKIELLENNKKISIDISKIKKDWRHKKFNITIEPSLELARLLGYYLSEGFSNYQGIFLNFGSHELELINDSMNCIRKVFNVEPTVGRAHYTATRVRIYSQNIKQIFDEWKIGDNALNKKIPDFAFNWNKELKRELLKAYIAGDGHKRRGYEISTSSSSKELTIDLQYILASLGVSSSISEREETTRDFIVNSQTQTYQIQKHYTTYIQAIELFNLGRKLKNNSFINLIPTKEIINNIEVDKIDWRIRRSLRTQKYITTEKLSEIKEEFKNENLKKYLKGDLRTLPIKEIRILNKTSEYVYDIEVEDNHTFFAGDFPIGISNCVGGLAGNRTTPIVVSIVASAGLTIPKTSTRSITSPAGTSDCVEVLAPVAHSKEKIMEIVNKTNACMVWGGTLDLASADDKLIQLEKQLNLDPEGFLLASILAKKASVGSKYILIDIPIGPEAKTHSKEKAEDLSRKFIALGKKLGMIIKVIITDGSQPIGNGIGPALEAKDVLLVLQNKGPQDLKRKSVYMTGLIFEMVGIKDSYKKALEILESGQAYKKMQEIIKAQGGNPLIQPEEIKLGKFTYTFKSQKTGKVSHINNNLVIKISKNAGAPTNKGAGIYLHKKVKDQVKEKEPLFTIYSENKDKLIRTLKENLNEVVKIS